MSRLWQHLCAVLIGILLFWGGAEVVSRLVFSQIISFDVEMWRYARWG
jgi:TRAP-type C4-dicarboxylate transport system permease small subunit